MEESFKEFLSQKRIEYSNIGHVECPAFGNERIYFTGAGFRHLVGKERRRREKHEQIKRVALSQFAPGILKRSMKFVTHFSNIEENKIVRFWSFEERINGIVLTVVVRQIDSHPKHFFSIFSEKTP